jgi:hypothetical protein
MISINDSISIINPPINKAIRLKCDLHEHYEIIPDELEIKVGNMAVTITDQKVINQIMDMVAEEEK